MIGPLLRAVASAAAARSLRSAARDAATHVALSIAALLAIGVAAICLSFSAYVLLERQLDAAAASAIVGGFWGVLGLSYFVIMALRRRKS